VRRAGLLLDGRPGRENAQLAVDLHAVGIDDDATQPFGEPQRKARLAAGRGPGDQDGAPLQRQCHAHTFDGIGAPINPLIARPDLC
jgi:hypothetical protein